MEGDRFRLFSPCSPAGLCCILCLSGMLLYLLVSSLTLPSRLSCGNVFSPIISISMAASSKDADAGTV